MNIFLELYKQYSEINKFYVAKELEAANRNWSRKKVEWARKRELNDQAYFLFMFSRLEDQIREKSSELISKKQRITNWKQRRPWDILPKNRKSYELNFKNRLALLVDKGSSKYRDIIKYYKKRNIIAHGGIVQKALSPQTDTYNFIEYSKMFRS